MYFTDFTSALVATHARRLELASLQAIYHSLLAFIDHDAARMRSPTTWQPIPPYCIVQKHGSWQTSALRARPPQVKLGVPPYNK